MEKTVIQYRVTGMACGGCLNRVKDALTPYAESVKVSLEPPIATLVNASAAIDTLNAALDAIGHYHLNEGENL